MCDYDDLLNPLNPLSPINPIYQDLLYGDDTDSKEDNNKQNQDEENIRKTHQESKVSHEITEPNGVGIKSMIDKKVNEIAEIIFNENKDVLLERVDSLIELDDFKSINKKSSDEEEKKKFNRDVNCRSLDLTGMLLENENFEEYKIKSSSLLGNQINEKLIKMYEKELREKGYFAIASRKNIGLDICLLKRHFLLYSFLNLPWMETIAYIIVFLGTMTFASLILGVGIGILYLLFIAPIY